ncbi:MAG TPA: response regulator transcription factor, partial [Pirellulales bacterium]
IVDDEPELVGALYQAFEEQGYAVDAAYDGREGLLKALTADYDAIVLDGLMPRLDGWRFLSELREKARTPVLMLTACDAVDDKIRGLDEGADDYLTKPFDLLELLARVRALVRRASAATEPVLTLGDVILDTNARSVSKAGERVHLAAKEYALLELLARRRGQIVDRNTIHEKLYDEYDDNVSNAVEVYVSSLRKKLGKDLVQTVRNQGYRIDPA